MHSEHEGTSHGRLAIVLEGRSEVLEHSSAANLEDVPEEPRSTVTLVLELQRDAQRITDEVRDQLLEATGLYFRVQLSFHRGSVIIQGIVSTLATAEVFQAAANFGGALALAQTVAAIVSMVVSRHLPLWMSRPVIRTTASGIPQAAPVAVSFSKRGSGVQMELRAIKWCVVALVGCAALATGKYLFGA